VSKFSHGNTKASKLTAERVLDMRTKYASGVYTQASLSREFQVSIATVRNVVNGLTWQGVEMVKPEHQLRYEEKLSLRKLNSLMEVDAPAVELTPAEIERLNRELLQEVPSVEEALPSTDEVLNRRAARAALKEDSDESVEKTDESKGQGQGSEAGALERGSASGLAEVQGTEGSAGRSVVPGEEAEAGEV
jgi:hypothetical protein